MPIKLTELVIDRVAVVPAGANQHADIVFFKAKEGKPPTPDPEPQPDKEPVTMTKIKKIDRSKLSDEQKTALDAILKAAGLEEEAEEPAPAELPEEVVKSLPENVQALIRKSQEDAATAKRQAEEAIAKAAKAEADAAIEKDARLEAEFVKSTEPVVKAFPGQAGDNAKLLYRIKKAVSADDYQALEKLLKAGSEGISKASAETGDGGGNNTDSAYNQLMAKAEELRKADSKLTKAKAFQKACEGNPDLVEQYRQEQGIAVV